LEFVRSTLLYGWTNGNKDEIAKIQNQLPNSGGFPIDAEEYNPEKVISSIGDPYHRQTSVDGFEGFALDDALAYVNEYKHFSFLNQAKAIAQIAKREVTHLDASVLELGCGGGDMHRFLKAFGIERYIGVDVNPVAFKHSPHITKSPQNFRLLNLQEEIDFGMKFDVVCSFEVLEHIREEKLDSIIGTIKRHIGEKSIFLGTASLQDDLDVHVTVRPREFWMEKFAQHGLVRHDNHAAYESLLAENHPFNWNAENTNVFALKLCP
jgi:cyclopropane fatty-acyl-phospholipid synthase-like methyltransferase